MKTRQGRLFSCLALALLSAGFASAQTATNTINTVVNQVVPDNDLVGLSSTLNLNTSILQITDVNVTVNVSGGFEGDLYAYLTHGSGFSVLLNRAGRTAGNTFGFSTSGFGLTFDDAAATDVHASGGAGSGTFQPDARNVNPTGVLDTSTRSAFLSSFNNLNASGDWTLFMADVSPAGGSQFVTLNDWTLVVTGSLVPEPSTWALLAAGGTLLLCFRRRRP